MNIQQTTPTPKLVTMIPADPQMAERDLRKKHLRVAPYCRVSTDKEEQLSSYEAQIEYYTEKIDANPDWTMVRLYADATDIIGLKQNPTNGRRFSPIFSFIGHLSE